MLDTEQQQVKNTVPNNKLASLKDEHIYPNILAVDDDPIMRVCLEELLKTYGYHCTLAENGKNALSLLTKQKFEIILLDLMMPEMNGHQVMAQITEKFPDIDVIIVSGDATFDNATKALRLGAKDFISKPYKPDELIKCIRHIQETRKLQNKIADMHQRVLVSEQRYKFFINNSPDLIYMLDHKGKITFINDRVTDFLGYEAKDLIGKKLIALF